MSVEFLVLNAIEENVKSDILTNVSWTEVDLLTTYIVDRNELTDFMNNYKIK